ncbi:MAG: mercuric transport protein MerTP [Cyclonatronaceae bacterium]
MNSENKWLGAGIAAAFIAALCCITPVFAVLAGIGGIAATFSFLEPFRPWLIGLTVLFLGFAWFQQMKPKKEIDCACEDNPTFFKSKRFLGIVTLAVGLLVAFPYYSHIFIQDNSPNVVYVSESLIERVSFDVDGMTCSGCEASVKRAVQNVDGVLETDVSYATRSATIAFDKTKTTREALVQAINSTGFRVAD